MYFELDGTFPNHEANPLEPKNLVDLQKAVVEHKADLGLAFDGDADRCFVIDENGNPVTPSAVAAMVAKREIARARSLDKDADKIETLWDSSGLLDYDLWDVKRITRHRIRKGKVQLHCEFNNINKEKQWVDMHALVF